MVARNARKSKRSLVRIGQGRYQTLDLDTRKCLSCMGAEPPGSDVSCATGRFRVGRILSPFDDLTPTSSLEGN